MYCDDFSVVSSEILILVCIFEVSAFFQVKMVN